ncbi:hypothetical protein FDP41_011550 [Naegleria fowleri]|uniref:receptor protein-tyrosine kinase n=1 Tax=Naegleria fowleri TaxID=5763 RepID=A0A6A5CAA9_NAEFO|nr:uncharacterized protein FDP41_011550 [Naegleria fowleri]KAF0982620.1 hypothetical protein FDP41_011550 [Naegleria fowleri]
MDLFGEIPEAYDALGNVSTPSNTQPVQDHTPITPQTPSVNFTELIGLEDTHTEIQNAEAAQQKLASLYNQEEFSDIVFMIRKRKFYAIKALVVGWSPVFKSMLYGDFMEADLKEVPLDDVDPVAFEMFLRVIYSGKSGLYPVHNFVDLYAFANRFEIPEIEKLCLDALHESSLSEHVFSLIDACEKYSDLEEIEQIRRNVVAKICGEFDDVVQRPDFVNMTPDYLLRFLKSDLIVIPEDVLFKALMKWIDHNKEERAKYIDEFLSFIRFPLMDPQTLTEVEYHPLLVDKQKSLQPTIFEAMKYQLYPESIPEDRRKNVSFLQRELPEDDSSSTPKFYKKMFTLTSLGCTGSTVPTTMEGHYPKEICKFLTLKNGFQNWKVHATGKYKIVAVGASGGDNPFSATTKAGKGAMVAGVFKLKKGQNISIIVGQRGEDAKGGTGGGAAGGGGGTFVVDADLQQPLLIAAGGNGANWYSFTVNGPDGQLPNPSITESLKNTPATADRGGGGGGFYVSGANGSSCTGGKSYFEGLLAGRETSVSYGGNGGFGGGGGAEHEGGGGGGYIGGKSLHSNEYSVARPDYGAYSFNSGDKQEGQAGYNTGNGYVTISRVFY